MIATLKRFFSDLSISDTPELIDIELAVAVLLIEVGKADTKMTAIERTKIANMLVKAFTLSQAQAIDLLDKALQHQDESVSLQTFTSVLKDKLSYAERVRFVKGMWIVAYADQELDPYEDHVIRKISDLLYLKHSDFIQTKLLAESLSRA